MKRMTFFALVLTASCLAALSGCGGGNDEPTPYVCPSIVEITENVDAPTTWPGDKLYLIRAYDFYVNDTLVIEPGAIIKFHPADGPYMMLGGTGTIIAQGTASKPIVFTSYKDDAHGCDTNGDGALTQPSRLDWGGHQPAIPLRIRVRSLRVLLRRGHRVFGHADGGRPHDNHE